MQLMKEDRAECRVRTLETLREMLGKFNKDGNIKNAKKYANVIEEPIFNVPLNQVISVKQYFN